MLKPSLQKERPFIKQKSMAKQETSRITVTNQGEPDEKISKCTWFYVSVTNKEGVDVIGHTFYLPKELKNPTFGYIRHQVDTLVNTGILGLDEGTDWRFMINKRNWVPLCREAGWNVGRTELCLSIYADGSFNNPHRIYIKEVASLF